MRGFEAHSACFARLFKQTFPSYQDRFKTKKSPEVVEFKDYMHIDDEGVERTGNIRKMTYEEMVVRVEKEKVQKWSRKKQKKRMAKEIRAKGFCKQPNKTFETK